MKALRSPSWLSFEGFGVSSPFDQTFHYVTSPVFSPVILGVFRLLFAVYALITAIITLTFDSVVFHDANTSVAGRRRLCGETSLLFLTQALFLLHKLVLHRTSRLFLGLEYPNYRFRAPWAEKLSFASLASLLSTASCPIVFYSRRIP